MIALFQKQQNKVHYSFSALKQMVELSVLAVIVVISLPMKNFIMSLRRKSAQEKVMVRMALKILDASVKQV